ncbi:hypothetical protein [Chondromyces apiculatus]|uniref:Uncharacterized protein n=1 Tax=Chondromyces apiculatus DSM 436 TaxID=1192034 RepID=A0A017T2Z5_9BACT|nr:hypothetical protein [Chondromyces apiculatus]EYF02926.1 Hypothetical protein CAP_6349 [Chondromyces apiculatus DSM 436]
MARLIGILNEGSLLKRTLVHVGTFALGSMTFVALTSFLLVTITRAVLPSDAESSAVPDEAAAAEELPLADKPSLQNKPLRTRRQRNAAAAAPAAPAAPAGDAE